ncbi:MAG: hypothetical protein LBL95_10180 [Deltaproteobacteria bacterium]|nr:hypothetical protein [Deltaproteobacteria bacterium]
MRVAPGHGGPDPAPALTPGGHFGDGFLPEGAVFAPSAREPASLAGRPPARDERDRRAGV